MAIQLSVLDQSPILQGSSPQEALQQTIELAKRVDQLGYKRFWMSEHHSAQSLAGSTPELLTGIIAQATERIKVGTGGVLLPHYSTYKVAEIFRTLESLYPGRIDLGVGRAPGGMPGVNYALNKGKYPDVQSFPKQVADLLSYLEGGSPEGYQAYATPLGPTVPPVWILGSSGSSAGLAGELGANYTFAQFINPDGGPAAIQQYYAHFIPSERQKEPSASAAVFTVVGNTEEEAEYLASSLDVSLLMADQGQIRNHFMSPEAYQRYTFSYFEAERVKYNRNRMIVGNVESVKQQLEQMAADFQIDEIIANIIVYPFEKRLESYEKLAQAFQLNRK